MKNTNPVDEAISSNLTIMEMYLQDMLHNVQTAQQDITEGKRNAAIGALLCSDNQYADLKTLFDAILVLQKSAALVEGTEL